MHYSWLHKTDPNTVQVPISVTTCYHKDIHLTPQSSTGIYFYVRMNSTDTLTHYQTIRNLLF